MDSVSREKLANVHKHMLYVRSVAALGAQEPCIIIINDNDNKKYFILRLFCLDISFV